MIHRGDRGWLHASYSALGDKKKTENAQRIVFNVYIMYVYICNLYHGKMTFFFLLQSTFLRKSEFSCWKRWQMLSKFKENMIATEYWKNFADCDVIMVLFAQHSIEHYKVVRNYSWQAKKQKPNNFCSAFSFFQRMSGTVQRREQSDILSLLWYFQYL